MGDVPVRIQRKRTRGWTMPPGAVYVGRPSMWGNPFRVGVYSDNQAECVEMFRWCLSKFPVPLDRIELWRREGGSSTCLIGMAGNRLPFMGRLRGHDLVCWCPLGAACHADILLEIANREIQP